MTPREKAAQAFCAWYDALPIRPRTGGPARGTIAAALVVLERLKETFDLNLDSHRAAGRSQIKGVSGAAVSHILAGFGETRSFLSEGGRTNRGAPGDISRLLDALKSVGLNKIAATERQQILRELQQFLVTKVQDFHSRQRLKFVYEPSRTTRQMIQDLLADARENGKEGPVAQYLVGAKLQLRFPEIRVENASYSTADDPLGRPGDFHIGDTAFHVTVAPMLAVYEKCKRNLQDGLKVFLLVPDRTVAGARQNADLAAPGQIVVEAIESFVAQNLDELSVFSRNKLAAGLRQLLDAYNSRVNAVENDKSMLIEIPQNLLTY